MVPPWRSRGRLAPPPWMCVLIDHVERRPVGISRRRRRCFAVPVVDETFRCSDAFEHGVGGSHDMAADGECPLAAVRVGDLDHEQPGADVSFVADVVMRQRKCAWSQSETHEACHRVAAASSRPATGIEGLPCPTTGYVLCVPGIGAIRARSHKRDLRAIVGARRGHSAGRDGARAEIDADDVPPDVVVASRSAEAWGESGGPRRQQCRGWGSLLTSEGEADQANARESAQGPRIHCVFLLLGLPPIASVQSGSTRLFRCTGGGRAAHRWKCLRHLLGVGRTARTDVDTDSGVEPTGRIAARRTAVTPGDLDTVSTPGPHTTAGKNVPARSPNARSALATAGQLRLGRYVEIPNPRTGESI